VTGYLFSAGAETHKKTVGIPSETIRRKQAQKSKMLSSFFYSARGGKEEETAHDLLFFRIKKAKLNYISDILQFGNIRGIVRNEE